MKRAELEYTARELLRSQFHGVLSTLHEQTPYGSLVRFSLDEQCQPVLMLSRIAEHTKAIAKHCKVSLFVLENDHEIIQECSRLTLSGELAPIAHDDPDFTACFESYITYFPETENYFHELDFDLYRLKIEECRYIGGFAAAHTISGENFREQNPLDANARKGILSHMNRDHSDAILHYCDTDNISLNDAEKETVSMVSIDAHGFHLRIENRIERITFPEAISDRVSAREALVAMAKRG